MADDNGPPMTIAMVVLTIVSLLFMTLRFYCKQALSTKLGLDDIVLAFSWLLFLVFVVISIYCTKFGLGKHIMEADMTQLPQLLYLLPIGQFFAVVSVAVSKSSFILTLLRLVTVTWQKGALWFMFATINASMLSIAIVQFYQCAPGQQNCVSSDTVIALGVFAAAYSAAMDLVLTLFPSLVIWNLQMKMSEKLGVIISMSLGVVAGVVGIYKSSTIPYVARNADFTYGTPVVLIWLVAEVTATILAASIPFFRPLIRRVSSAARSGKDAYGMGNMGRGAGSRAGWGTSSHSKLGSQADVKSDYHSDGDTLPPNSHSMIVRKTKVTVEYGGPDADVEKGDGPEHGLGRRDMF